MCTVMKMSIVRIFKNALLQIKVRVKVLVTELRISPGGYDKHSPVVADRSSSQSTAARVLAMDTVRK